MHPVLFDLDRQISIRCDPVHGQVRIGQLDFERAPALTDPDELDEEVGEASGASLVERAVELLPRHGELPEVGRQATWCTLTGDGHGLTALNLTTENASRGHLSGMRVNDYLCYHHGEWTVLAGFHH